MMATPDGLVYFGDALLCERGLEIKVHGRDAIIFGGLSYGAPGSDDIPMHELCQCAWGMAVVGVRRWDHVVFLDGAPVEYIIDRDEELIETMVDAGHKFMRDHIETGIAPDPDGSKSYGEYLKRWKTNTAEMVDVSARPDVLADIEALRTAKDEEAKLERKIETLVQRLKDVIKDRAGLVYPPERADAKPQAITWKRNKSGTNTDWLGVLADMRQQAALVASGKTLELDVIEKALRKLGGGYVGETTLSGIQLAEVFTLARQTLIDIAKASTMNNRTVATIGNRPFSLPKHWKQTRKEE